MMPATVQPIFNNGSVDIELPSPSNSNIGTTSTLVFGLLGVFASALTIWQGHRVWKYRHQRNGSSKQSPRASTSSIELHIIDQDSAALCPPEQNSSSSTFSSRSYTGIDRNDFVSTDHDID